MKKVVKSNGDFFRDSMKGVQSCRSPKVRVQTLYSIDTRSARYSIRSNFPKLVFGHLTYFVTKLIRQSTHLHVPFFTGVLQVLKKYPLTFTKRNEFQVWTLSVGV